MVTIIFGQTLVMWSGLFAGISFALLMVTCAYNLGCANGICSNEKRKKLSQLHKYFVWSTIITVAIHIILALLSSVFYIWL
ncbi:MAG TPA: hypothetical protein VI977_02275 [archaeon]|nr:hypothetical protein [archaeon]